MDDFPIKFHFVEGVAVVTVEGTLDWEMTALVAAAVGQLFDRERYRIVLDLLNPGESAEILSGWVMGWTEEQRDLSIDYRIIVVSDNYRFVHDYQTRSLDRFIPLIDSVYGALDSLLGAEDL